MCRNTVCQGILSGVTACFVAAGSCRISFCRILLAAVIGSACVSCRTETGPVTVPAASGNMYAAYFELLPDAVVSVSPFTGTGDTLFIDAPMDNIVCMSSSHMSFLSEAGASEVVTGVSGKRFVTDRKIAGNVVEVGYESAFDYESVMALKPDVVLAYTVSSVEPAYISRLEDLGIRVLVLYDHLEQHPLARAEYIRLAGAITGRKEYADSVFSEVARRYTSIAAAVRGVPDVVLALIIYIMACYMLTVDYPYLRSQAVQHTHQRLRRFLKQVRDTALAAFGGYLRAEFLLSVVVFFILLVGFFVIGQSYGLLLALGLAVMDFIPIIGAGTVMVPWAAIDLFMGNWFHAVELMLIWGVIALFRRVGEPKFVGDQTGLSPITSLISIYIGWRVAGVLGMILGPTIALVALNLIKLGLFEGVRLDLAAAAGDIMAVLRERPPKMEE